MEEIWKDIDWIENCSSYQISNLGRVKSFKMDKKGKILKASLNTDGYYIVHLHRNNMPGKTISVHILVAKAFVPNPNNYPEVNHKDCCRTNNCSDNLEWMTHVDNVAYSVARGRYKHYGEDNSNFGNHILADRYRENKELAKELLSRPRGQNGHAKKIRAYNDDESYTFDCITDCAEWLKNKFNFSTRLESVRGRIGLLLDSNKMYKTFLYESI